MIALATWAIVLAAALSLTTSLAIAGAGRLSAPLAARIDPRSRARLWLAAAFAPALVSALVLGAVLLPRGWLGLEDHCAHHLHHLHLCARHGAPWPPPLVVAVAALWLARVVGLWAQRAFDALRAQRHVHGLAQLGETALSNTALSNTALSNTALSNTVRLPTPGAPLAFTAGWLSPRVFATGAVIDDPRWSAVLAHERDHARHRDPLARLVARFVLALGAPFVAEWLDRQLVAAQELAADDAAAREVGDRVEVARQLVAWVRAHRPRPLDARGAGFEQGDVAGRVRALVDAPPYRSGPSARSVFLLGLALACAALALADPLHHGVETILGAIGA